MRLTTAREASAFDPTALLHPEVAFDHPEEVVRHQGLTIGEKRAILASWASDTSAVASCPHLRVAKAPKAPVRIEAK